MEKAPDLYIVMEYCGDSYGHGSTTPVAWFFDEDEAGRWADIHNEATGSGQHYTVESCQAGNYETP